MKKRISLIVLFCTLSMIWVMIISEQNKTTWLDMDDNGIYISLKTDNREEVLRPWFDWENDIHYFFLPAFADDKDVYIDRSLSDVIINETNVKGGHKFTWQTDEEYRIIARDVSYHVRFMRSENLPAFFMDTESGDMEYIHKDKNHEETGNLTVISTDGHLQYAGALDRISGRGNTTFWDRCYKRPYSITLHKETALCGLERGKKWNLLALFYEWDRMHTKIALDMAREMGITCTPESTWVDLYCNEKYVGLYLLTETVSVGDGRVEIHDLEAENERINSKDSLEKAKLIQNDDRQGYDILSAPDSTGGYLLEKEGNDPACFVTSSDYRFAMKSPKHASLEQVNYIADFVQNIEDMLVLGDVKYRDYIDLESFSKQFLLDKIGLEYDAMKRSTFFYKDKEENVLHAGPVWDYDKSIGIKNSDYEVPIEGEPNAMPIWYMTLYNDEVFYNLMMEEYRELLPYMKKVLDEDIDHYAEMIRASVAMDGILMEKYAFRDNAMCYIQYDCYVKYLKYFLANRLNYLNSIWEISDMSFEAPPPTGEYHNITFIDEKGNVLGTGMVLDGESVKEFPSVDEKYQGWYMNETYRKCSEKVPIYEDTVLEAYYE